ncbi:MAG: hypothetical protein RJA63_2336 [Pseudomonadota bacterium]|jgi:hypothetical protein
MLLEADKGDTNFGTISTERVAFGSKAWKTTATAGATEWAMGGGANFPTSLGKGQSVHAQWSVYFPADFDWYACGGGRLKFFRIRTEPAGGGNRGYLDLYLKTLCLGIPASEDGELTYIFEGNSGTGKWWYDTGEVMQKGVWETFEIQVDFDDVPKSQGGTGRVRVWRKKGNQMALILDLQDGRTLASATDYAPFFYIFTYWNGGAPKTQSMYIDRVVIEKDMSKLVETDAAGNKIIGGL